MSGGERLVGAGAVLMALCCAGGPLIAAGVGGGLITGAGTLGVVCGVILLLSVAALFVRRRRGRRGC